MIYAFHYDPDTGDVLGKLKFQSRADFEAMENVVEVVASTDPARFRINPATSGAVLLLPIDVKTTGTVAPADLDLSEVPDGSRIVLMNENLDRMTLNTPVGEPVILTEAGTYFVHVTTPVEYKNGEFWLEVFDA